jgi:Mn-containing catalase
MFYHVRQLIHPIVDDQPDPAAANALQEGLGGQKALETKLFSAEVPQSVVGHH